MKYIRTKDNNFIKLHSREEYEQYAKEHNVSLGYDNWFRLIVEDIDILKQADTIWELCDEFVGVLTLENGHICHIWYNDEYLGITEWDSYEEYMEKIWEYAKANKSLDEIIYGAIWTDKGLIYVAKMNDKGELELL